MKHFSYIKGSSIFEISGENRNRLINVCTKNDILLLVKYKLNKCLFYVHFKDKDRFLIYVKKLGLHYKLIKEKGLPILYYKYKVRYWVFVFLIGFALLLWKFSLYIWNIKVIGTSNYTSEQILKYVSTYEVPIGTKISEIDCTLLEKSLRQKYDNLGWINCYITGTQLTIEVLETIPPMEAKSNDSPCNIIAIKNATITDAIATSGYLLVEKGMEVSKGDTLITGILPIYNDYGEEQGTRFIAANGYVYGLVTYEYKDIINKNQVQKIATKNKTKYSISLGSIHLFDFDKGKTNIVTEYKQLKIGKAYYLPISLCKKEYTTYIEKTVCLSDQELKNQSMDNLQNYILELRKKGVEIIQNNVKIHIVNGRCIASGQIICKEQIGIAVPIDGESRGEE